MSCCDDCENGDGGFCWGKMWDMHGGHLIMFAGVYVGASMLKVRTPLQVAGLATSIDFVKKHFIDGMPIM